MATWENLTQEQQTIYQAWERDLRASHGAFQRVLNTFARLDTTYNAQILGILVALDDNTIVPNSSGLEGAASLDSDAETVTLVSHMQNVMTTFNTVGHKHLRDKAAGGAHTAGEI